MTNNVLRRSLRSPEDATWLPVNPIPGEASDKKDSSCLDAAATIFRNASKQTR